MGTLKKAPKNVSGRTHVRRGRKERKLLLVYTEVELVLEHPLSRGMPEYLSEILKLIDLLQEVGKGGLEWGHLKCLKEKRDLTKI